MKKSLLAMAFCTLISTTSYSVTPDQILADGVNKTMVKGIKVRKGTIGALIVNAKLLSKDSMESLLSPEGLVALQHIRETIEGVYGIGLFDILPLKGWLSDDSKPGNILVAAIALQEMPNLMTPELKKRIRTLLTSQAEYVNQELIKLIKEA